MRYAKKNMESTDKWMLVKYIIIVFHKCLHLHRLYR